MRDETDQTAGPGDGIVAIARCATYEDRPVATALAEVLDALGGMKAFVKPGDRVCIKPNLLMKATPDRAVTTHPYLLRAVIREVKECGAGSIVVGDSPAGRQTAGSIRAAWRAAGWTEVCQAEDVELVLFDEDVVRVSNPHSSLYGSFNLGRAAVEADVLIDLPKFKTHGFQLFTGAVKNLFGCIPGLEKAQFHVKVPDRYDFARMLVDLMFACPPSLAIMDAVVGMEGDGPSGGTPVQIGALLASADCPALDVVASAVAGFEPMDVYTNRVANERGLCPRTADEVAVRGVPWREIAPERFERPVKDLASKLPASVARRVRDLVVSRPYLAAPADCTACRSCESICPVEAVKLRDRKPVFDYDRCIRCYCCQETCPTRCIRLKTPWLIRLVVGRETGAGA